MFFLFHFILFSSCRPALNSLELSSPTSYQIFSKNIAFPTGILPLEVGTCTLCVSSWHQGNFLHYSWRLHVFTTDPIRNGFQQQARGKSGEKHTQNCVN